jgi:hypothetical protein
MLFSGNTHSAIVRRARGSRTLSSALGFVEAARIGGRDEPGSDHHDGRRAKRNSRISGLRNGARTGLPTTVHVPISSRWAPIASRRTYAGSQYAKSPRRERQPHRQVAFGTTRAAVERAQVVAAPAARKIDLHASVSADRVRE